MKKLLIVCLVILSQYGYSRPDKMSPSEYIERFKGAAIEEMERTGIPASITLAQGMLESGNGNSRLARKANNHFGIKCHSGWNGPSIRKDDDAKNECFRKYKSPWKSYRDHSDFLVNRSRYAFLFDLKSNDYKGWAKGLKKAGYATNPKYPKLLINLIERNKLYVYDSKKGRGKLAKEVKGKQKEKSENYITEKENVVTIASRIKVSSNYVKYIVIKKGDTYYSLEKELGVRTSRMMKYNEKNHSTLELGERIYLQPKKKSTSKKYYKVKKGDNLYLIAQQFAVTTKSIMKRNRMRNSVVRVGQKIKLKGRKIKK